MSLILASKLEMMMEKYKAPLSFKVIHILNEIIFWLFSLVTLLAFVFAILVFAGVFREGMQLHVNLPVAFDTEEVGYIVTNDIPSRVQLVEAYGKVHFIDTPINIARLYMLPLLIVVSMMFTMMFIFRKFIRNVRKGIIFEIKNIKLLRMLAIGLLTFWTFWRTYDWISGMILEKRLNFSTISLSTATQDHNVLLISSLVLWVLSHIFIQGMKLNEENSLTI